MPVNYEKLFTGRASGAVHMWGTLHFDPNGRAPYGWLCDAWTERGTPYADSLKPKLYWLSSEDKKFHRAHIDIPFGGAALLIVHEVDEAIEPRRDAFMRTKLREWEDEFIRS
jgi:hypothetical protein